VSQTLRAVGGGGEGSEVASRYVPLSDAGGFIAPVRSTGKYLCSVGDNYFVRGDRGTAVGVLQRRLAFLVGRRAKVVQSLLQAGRAIADSAQLLGGDASRELEQVLVACKSVFVPGGASLDSDIGRRVTESLLARGGSNLLSPQHADDEDDADSADLSGGPGLRTSSESSDLDTELTFTPGPSASLADPASSSLIDRLLEAEQSFTGDPSGLDAEEHAKHIVRRVKGGGGGGGGSGKRSAGGQPTKRHHPAPSHPATVTRQPTSSSSTSAKKVPVVAATSSPAAAPAAAPAPAPAPKARPPSRFKQERSSKRVPSQAEAEMMSRVRRL
jgi:hypothetical protein